MTKALACMAFAAIAAIVVSMSTGAASVAASNAQNGQLHVTKDCSVYTGAAGSYCTIESSNLAEIPVGTRVFYDQAYGIPAPNGASAAGMLDSNIVLYAGFGNWAVGRCTLNVDGSTGLCTFSDGVGPLAGFSGRVNVTYTPTAKDPALFSWDGTYSFNPLPPK
jgi:hypothetical protein